jgi:hypothetical protein
MFIHPCIEKKLFGGACAPAHVRTTARFCRTVRFHAFFYSYTVLLKFVHG